MRPSGRVEGLVGGLAVGRNTLKVKPARHRAARLAITNHPNGGPLFGSG